MKKPTSVADFERILAAEGLADPDEPTGRRRCQSCERRARKGGLYCGSCIAAHDQVPNFDAGSTWHTGNVDPDDIDDEASSWTNQVALLPSGASRTGRSAINMDAARALLWSGTLTPEQFKVWERYCDGDSERAIAKAIGRNREWLHNHLLGELKARCGIKTRAYEERGCEHRKGPKRSRACAACLAQRRITDQRHQL